MLIDLDLLRAHGGTIHTYDSHDYIFQIEETPRCYYQIVSGDVKLNYTNEDGKELIQSLLTKVESVCELLLFVDHKYPVNAVTMSDCTIMKVPKVEFLHMLDEHPRAAIDVRTYISKTLYQKFIMMQNIASTSAEERIKGTLKYFKSFFPDKTPFSYEVKLTRQQFASITGLRTETVIRTLKKLGKRGICKNRRSEGVLLSNRNHFLSLSDHHNTFCSFLYQIFHNFFNVDSGYCQYFFLVFPEDLPA